MYQKLQNNLRSNGSTPSPPPGLSRAAGNIPRVRTVVGAPPPVEKKVKLLPKIGKREAKKQAQEKNNSPAPEATTSASPVPAQAQAPASTPAPTPATAGVIGGVASLEEKKLDHY